MTGSRIIPPAGLATSDGGAEGAGTGMAVIHTADELLGHLFCLEQNANAWRWGGKETNMATNLEHPKADPTSNAEKAPENWTTGDERMTGAQASYLKTLAEEAGDLDAFDPSLTKAEASLRIDALQEKTGRGADG